MAIRIRKDKKRNSGRNYKNNRQSNRNQPSFNGGSGGGMIGALLPMAMGLFKKNPKIVIILAVVAGAIYFLGGSKMCSSGVGEVQSGGIASFFSKGLNMDQDVYDKAEIFEPLADNKKNPMPNKVSLLKYCPPRKNQGQQGSCVGWSSGYAARSILHARATGVKPKNATFSPSFVYNQIALKGCQGTYLQKAMELMRDEGALPFSKFAYNEFDCEKQPNSNQIQQAGQYRTKGFNRLTKGRSYKTDLLGIKQNLAQGAPVVIGMMVGGSFMTNMNGRSVWTPNKSDYNKRNFGGHAMCVIGYDDYKTDKEGAFQIMNSWGEKWGKKGIFWIRYSDFEYFTQEAYGLHPMGNSEKFATNKLSAKIGLVATNEYGEVQKQINIKYKGGITYETVSKLNVNDGFKVEITNDIECYVYVFGEKADGSSNVLFPYTAKHSPYCGITGTRIFPRDYSLFPDSDGSRDKIAIVISKQKLNFEELNTAINNARGYTFEQKVTNVLKDELIPNVKFGGKGLAELTSETTDIKNTAIVILEITK